MEKRDYIMDQIEQLGKVIAALISGFMGMKSRGKVALGLDKTNHQMKEKLDIDVDLMMTLTEDQLYDYFEDRMLIQHHLDKLATYFMEVGVSKKEQYVSDAKRYLIKAKQLMNLAAGFTKTTSLKQLNTLKQIDRLLGDTMR